MKSNNSIVDLTIDVDVLMRASGTGNPEYARECNDLLQRMLRLKDWFLALDARGKIEYQYCDKISEDKFSRQWLKEMYDRDKVIKIPWIQINRGIRTALKEAHFDSARREDFKYVETAAATNCKIISSHDPDYSKPVRKILRKGLGVLIKCARECLCI
jgi:hypothetical protein